MVARNQKLKRRLSHRRRQFEREKQSMRNRMSRQQLKVQTVLMASVIQSVTECPIQLLKNFLIQSLNDFVIQLVKDSETPPVNDFERQSGNMGRLAKVTRVGSSYAD
jgi:hypothetical protein